MSDPRLSIIINTYNRRESLLRCLEALDSQSVDRSLYEIVVADDGSTDGTLPLLANLAALVRNDAVHLKQAVLGDGDLALWRRANGSVLARLPSMFGKWRADRRAVLTAE